MKLTGLKRRAVTTKCGVCNKKVPETCQAIKCEFDCDSWYHIDCIGLTEEEYERLGDSDETWFCEKCALKHSNIVLRDEIKTLNQTITLLQGDVREYQELYEASRRQVDSLNDMFIAREEEVIKLQVKLEEANNLLARVGQPHRAICPSSFSEFPPLELKNRFTPLSDELVSHISDTVPASLDTINHSSSNKRLGACDLPQTVPGRRGQASSSFGNGRSPGMNHRSTPKDDGWFTPVSGDRPSRKYTNRLSKNHRSSDNPRIPNYKASDKLVSSINSGNKSVSGRNQSVDNLQDLSTNPTKNKLLLVSDSHGKNLYSLFEDEFSSKYEIFTLCRPGAKLNQCMHDIRYFTEGFTFDDYVVIIGGSNDIVPGVKSILSNEARHKISSLKSQTNVIFSTLPMRYDMQDRITNDIIHQCNHALYIDELLDDCTILPFNSFKRNLFTFHGQHLNRKGKKVLCSRIVECVNVQKNSNFL